jgi:Rrf2 family protein
VDRPDNITRAASMIDRRDDGREHGPVAGSQARKGGHAVKLSTKSEYACLALIDLVEHQGSGYTKTEDIARRKRIPGKYLEQILLTLKRARYLKSRKGPQGGYRLAEDPGRISMAEIVRLMDGALAPVESVSKYFYESTPIEQNKRLVRVFKDIRDYVAKKLEQTTFADLSGK